MCEFDTQHHWIKTMEWDGEGPLCISTWYVCLRLWMLLSKEICLAWQRWWLRAYTAQAGTSVVRRSPSSYRGRETERTSRMQKGEWHAALLCNSPLSGEPPICRSASLSSQVTPQDLLTPPPTPRLKHPPHSHSRTWDRDSIKLLKTLSKPFPDYSEGELNPGAIMK